MSSKVDDAFIKYYENPEFGKDFFFKAASAFETKEEGFMKYMTTNYPVVNEAINLSNMTHDWVAKAGGTELQNAKEHLIGMFLLSSKYGTSISGIIGNANEARGLIITDRQNGNMIRAIMGMPAQKGGPTGFEYTDLLFNELGRNWYEKYSNKSKTTK